MYIIHLGSSGFPSESAQMQRIKLIFLSLKTVGYSPLVINKHSVNKIVNLKRVGRFQDIVYIFTSLFISRPDNFFIRNFNKMTGYYGEIKILIKKRKDIKAGIFYSPSIIELLYYRIISKILRFKLIVQCVELRSSIHYNKRLLLRHINDKLFDSLYFYLCDGVIVISNFLFKQANKKRFSLPVIKIPAICDFSVFDNDLDNISKNYIMYCGSINYLQVILFVINLFCRLKEDKIYDGQLHLVVSNDMKEINNLEEIKNSISNCKYRASITLENNIPRNDLIRKYKEAELLIIPLRNTTQDIARFSHKVGEYTAAKRPIISTNIGEMNVYFKDGFSAILASTYSVNSYVEKLSSVLKSKEQLKKIGEEGYKVGSVLFDFRFYSLSLKNFIDTL